MVIIFISSLVFLYLPIFFWKKNSTLILFLTIFLLIIVLLLGKKINGSTRWINLGFFYIQPSEITKLSLFFYISNYLTKKIKKINNFWHFLKPIFIVLIISTLIIFQPDFGTVVILFSTTLCMLFIAGAKLWQFFLIIFLGMIFSVMLIIFSSYRIKRIIYFFNPWLDPFNAGYQIINSLIAFGRGSIFGEGLGNSLQKLNYLPESHTDFIFAIIAEEMGFLGSIFILSLIFFLSLRGMSIGINSFKKNQHFSFFLAFSISIWFFLQTTINIASVIGLIPTKGLTFPIISYGGSSLIITSSAIFILLRIDYENKIYGIQAFI